MIKRLLLTFSWSFLIAAVLVLSEAVSAGESESEKESLAQTEAKSEKKSTSEESDLFDMSIEQLMKVQVVSTASLTESDPRLVPAAVTTITEEQIQASGARSMFELLDIYVPNLQWMRHHWEADVMGLRGIIADRDDKYLLLVNGRNMNQRTHFGALSEQDQVLLRDIHHIDIVRGPGSALYGPGAVSMVINIVTHNASTFRGTDFISRVGAVEKFYTGEFRHGQKIDEDGGFFLYAGIGDYIGASKYDAPHVYPFTFPSTGGGAPDGILPWDGAEAGEPLTSAPIGNDGAAALGVAPAKVHIEVNRGNWDFWVRYTRGGKEFSLATGSLARSPYGWGDWAWYSKYGYPRKLHPNFYAYQQLTGYLGYKQEINDSLDIDYGISYDTLTYVKNRETRPVDDYREDEYYGKALLRWTPNDRHKIAFGFEYSHLDLGLGAWDGLGYSHPELCGSTVVEYPHGTWPYNVQMPRWSTNMFSYFGEHQWNINDRWTTFLGARLDDHTYTDLMFSPRATIVHTPNDRDTLKLMWSRSVRANFEDEMERQAMDPNNSSNSDPEVLDAVELRFERQQSENLDLASSLFIHYNLEVITYNNSLSKSVLVGTQREYGIELEALYHTDKSRLMISHGYTKLYDFDLEPGQNTYITGEPFGYGDDLTNWANHITKLTAQRKLNERWTFDASLRIYWGFPGKKDFDRYFPYSGDGAAASGDRIIEDGWERAYRGNYYLNLGLQYKPQKNLTFGIVGYNLLGVFNKDLNKRNYMDVVGAGDFRSHAPAVGVSMMYKF